MLNKKILILLIPAVVVFCFIVGIVMLANKYKHQNAKIRTPGQVALLKSWESESFTNIAEGEEFLNNVKKIKLQVPVTSLDAHQADELYQSVYNLLLAYSSGTYTNYLKFRKPVNGRYEANIIEFELNQLKSLTNNTQSLSLSDPESIQKAWWGFWDDRNTGICTQCWKKLGMASSHILIERLSKAPEDIRDTAWKYISQLGPRSESLGVLRMNPSFISEPSVQELLKKGDVVYATVFVNIQNSGDPTHPAFCRFYWEPTAGKWVPAELATLFAQERKFSVLF